MSNISGLLGTAGGFKGTGVDAPDSGVNMAQINSAYTGVQGGLAGQQDLLAQLQAQNGLGNQSQVYNQMQGVVNGTGPNPAQAQLAQATSANTANQAALMAGQRGSVANTGLIARQAAMQGGANQQNAAGQAATLQAQQSLNALQQAGGIANTQVSNQVGQTNANTAAQQAEQTALLNAQAGQASNNTKLIQGTAGQQAAIGGGGANAMGSMMAKGGQVSAPRMAGGGQLDQSAFQSPQSKFGQYLKGTPPPIDESSGDDLAADAAIQKGMASMGQGTKNLMDRHADESDANAASELSQMAKGGKVKALVSPGEQYLSPRDVKRVEKGANPLAAGERIPGKAKVKGNSYANDTVPKTLEAGGIVIPKSVMESKNPHWEAMKFVHAHNAKNKKMPKK